MAKDTNVEVNTLQDLTNESLSKLQRELDVDVANPPDEAKSYFKSVAAQFGLRSPQRVNDKRLLKMVDVELERRGLRKRR